MTMLVMDTTSLASKVALELEGPNETIWNIMTYNDSNYAGDRRETRRNIITFSVIILNAIVHWFRKKGCSVSDATSFVSSLVVIAGSSS